MQLYTCNHTAAQQVTYTARRHRAGPRQVPGRRPTARTANGTARRSSHAATASAAQIWTPQANGELVNPPSGRCLDVPERQHVAGRGATADLRLQRRARRRSGSCRPGQLTGPGGLCADVANADPSSGTAVQLYGCNSSPTRSAGRRRATARSASFGKCLDVANGGTANGTPVATVRLQRQRRADLGRRRPNGSLRNPQSGPLPRRPEQQARRPATCWRSTTATPPPPSSSASAAERSVLARVPRHAHATRRAGFPTPRLVRSCNDDTGVGNPAVGVSPRRWWRRPACASPRSAADSGQMDEGLESDAFRCWDPRVAIRARTEARHLEPKARSPAPGARSPAPEPGTWSPAPGARSPAPGARHLARSPAPGARHLEPGARRLEPGAWSPQPGTWSPEPGGARTSPEPAARSPAARSPQPAARSPRSPEPGARQPGSPEPAARSRNPASDDQQPAVTAPPSAPRHAHATRRSPRISDATAGSIL